MNLLTETLELLKRQGKSPENVQWVGVKERDFLDFFPSLNTPPKDKAVPIGSWGEFAAFADFDYNDGYGGNEINGDLVIVGDDWWLERVEYDGSEWWEFKTLPKKPSKIVPLRASDLKSRL